MPPWSIRSVEGIWTCDEEAQQFYRHVFYGHEPEELSRPERFAVRDGTLRLRGYGYRWLRPRHRLLG